MPAYSVTSSVGPFRRAQVDVFEGSSIVKLERSYQTFRDIGPPTMKRANFIGESLALQTKILLIGNFCHELDCVFHGFLFGRAIRDSASLDGRELSQQTYKQLSAGNSWDVGHALLAGTRLPQPER